MRRRALLAASQMTGGGTPDIPNTDEWDYYTVIPEEDCEVEMVPFSGTNDWILTPETEYECLSFSYRINGGDWIVVSLGTTAKTLHTISVKANDRIQVKCYGVNFDAFYWYDCKLIRIEPLCKFKVCGTPMSLLYGNDFKENNIVKEYILEAILMNSMVTEILNPESFLPYTILEPDAYSYMFMGCTELINAPVLPAEVLTYGCYSDMFHNCPKINYIKMLATDISADYCLYGWVSGVSPTGTFVKHPEATWDVRGNSGVPEGWTIKFDGEEEGGGTYDDYFGQIPPESTSFDFPLYITVPFLEEYDVYRDYERQADDLSFKLRAWFFENAEYTYNGRVHTYELRPDNIYINGVKVRIMYTDLMFGETVDDVSVMILLEGIFDSEFEISPDGKLYGYIYT